MVLLWSYNIGVIPLVVYVLRILDCDFDLTTILITIANGRCVGLMFINGSKYELPEN